MEARPATGSSTSSCARGSGRSIWSCSPIHSKTTREASRSEEHTSELQSRSDLVCRLLLEKKKYNAGAPPRSEGERHILPTRPVLTWSHALLCLECLLNGRQVPAETFLAASPATRHARSAS